MSGVMQVLLGGRTKFVRIADKNVTDSDLAITPDTSASASVTFTFSNTGAFTCERLNLVDLTYTGEWLVAGTASNWEIRFTGTGWSTGTFSTWLPLGTTRSISITASQSLVGQTSNIVTCTVEIRRVGSTVNEATCFLTAEATAIVEP